ncbi:uncharacterized protein BYT42DRAFT_585371 [Radiomyces spectabilis]|uniref:uncharacterized protein n=1 Tax=Radiomyces spectabilis TaxID=64574 RepID=UPI00221E6B87|nr:uncharacterized protein BYT42DRAFT_585371 [Radiomyces spectabilis]KAI8368129.1 hypothetical protein BYT42DRAFT_585371 [Radiomyces spectabilis]
MTSFIPCLLGGKTLTGVLPPEKQPISKPYLPSTSSNGRDQSLLDIESCIDDPSLAPLGRHVTARQRKSRHSNDQGEVHIQKEVPKKEVRTDGSLMLRRRGLRTEELAQHLDALLPPLAPFLQSDARYQDLVELDISRNRLTSLSSNITLLSQLKILNASSNLLTSIPKELYQLTQLEVLILNQNQLTSIPEEMPMQLPQLVTLRVAANHIQSLPSNIRLWRKMRHLQLGSVYGGNRLSSLPDGIVDMSALEDLDVSHNQLLNLPYNMFIPHLIHLNVSNNQLDAIPKSIAQCHMLRTLNVSKNHLTTLPADLVELRRLELFDISENLLCIMPADILERMRTTLLITGNPLTRPGHCDLGSADAYARILRQMTQRAVPMVPSSGSYRDRCGPQGMGCLNADEVPSPESTTPTTSPVSTSPSSSSPPPHHLAVVRRHCEDDDAAIDRELSFHARQLNIRGARPNDGPHLAGTVSVDHPVLEAQCVLLNESTQLSGSANLIHSLRELATRVILRRNMKVPFDWLPAHLAEDLSKNCRICAACQGAFVNEWVASVQVKSYKGHPAVVRRVRFCSTRCWMTCLEQSKEPTAKTVVCVRGSATYINHEDTPGDAMQQIQAAVAAATAEAP